MFGHSISLNFDRQGDSHKTFVGVLFSSFIYVFLLVFIVLKAKVLLYGQNDTNMTMIRVEDLQKKAPVKWKDLNLTIFFVIKK